MSTDLRKAKYTHLQRRRRRAIADGTWEYRQPAGPVIEHVAQLRALGMSTAAIATASGLAMSSVSVFAWPERRDARQFVFPQTAAAILAVTGPEQAPGWAHLPNVATRRRLEALQCMGWPLGAVAARLGVSRQAVAQTKRRPTVQVDHARRIATVYNDLAMRPGPDVKTRAWAAKHGYAPPLAWDDDTIDDPTATPVLGKATRWLDLNEWCHLVRYGEDPLTAAERCGVTWNAVEAAIARQNHVTARRLLEQARARVAA